MTPEPNVYRAEGDRYSRLDKLDGLDTIQPDPNRDRPYFTIDPGDGTGPRWISGEGGEMVYRELRDPATMPGWSLGGGTLHYSFVDGSGAPINQRKRLWLRFLLVLAALGALIAAAVLWASQSRADTLTDSIYLDVLAEQGIYADGGGAQLINAGHEICGYLDDGYSSDTVYAYIHAVTSLDSYNSGYLMGAAVGAYCPWHAGQIAA